MKITKLVLAGLLFSASCLMSCKKDDDNNSGGTASCSSISADAVIMDGISYVYQPAQAHNCGSGALYGGTIYTHFMSVHDGTTHTAGVSYNQPDLNFTLSSVPPAGTTTAYTLDEGMWMLGPGVPPTGKATFRMGNYYTGSNVQNWFSDSQSGTLQATADATGNVTISFSDVKLVLNGGSLTDRKTICAKDLICH